MTTSEILKAGGALAIRPDQTEWTTEQAAVLRQSGISDAVTKAELSGFLHLCQRTGLDPFSRQIYLIGRYSKKDEREVFTPQTGIDGYRVIAQRVTSQTGGTYGYEDTLWCDPSGRWRDVWLADAPPAAAKVTVIRNGMRFSAVARFSEYVQTFPNGNPKGLWSKMPAGQIAKCAEALALRKAFPHDLAGVYTAEEMAQADNQAPAPEPPTGPVQGARVVQQPEAPEFVPDERAQQHAVQAAEHDRGQDHIKARWVTAAQDGVINGAVLAPDTGQPDVLGTYLARLAKTLPETAAVTDGEQAPVVGQQQPADADMEAVAQAEAAAEVAEQELRIAASRVGLTELDAEFERSYGLPISQAPVAQLRQMTAILTGSQAA